VDIPRPRYIAGSGDDPRTAAGSAICRESEATVGQERSTRQRGFVLRLIENIGAGDLSFGEMRHAILELQNPPSIE
jgi:hypothetical protein